jgi:hypothetical protein
MSDKQFILIYIMIATLIIMLMRRTYSKNEFDRNERMPEKIRLWYEAQPNPWRLMGMGFPPGDDSEGAELEKEKLSRYKKFRSKRERLYKRAHKEAIIINRKYDKLLYKHKLVKHRLLNFF